MDALINTPLSSERLQQIAEEFFREGCVLLPSVLSGEEAAALRDKTDQYATAPNSTSKHITHAGTAFVLRYCHELDGLFHAMTTRAAILQIVQAVLGAGATFNAMNVIRNEPGQAITHWHVDDVLEFPLPDAIPRFDSRIRLPVFWLTVQVALSDIPAIEYGPTQFVPGSHYSGRQPNSQDDPEFEGRHPRSMLCKAGDAYLTNHQCWHRGAPNLSDRTRYIMQLQYAQGWAARRFKGIA